MTQPTSSRAGETRREQCYRALFENTHIAVYELDADGVFLDANAATAKLTGMSREELIGRALEDVVADSDLGLAREILGATLQGERREFELGILTSDRGRRTIEGISVPVEVDGRIATAFGTARDVTEERERQRQIELQAGLLSAVQQAVIATDLDGTIVFWNRFAEELYGWTAEEAVGRHILMVSEEEEHGRARVIMDDVARGEPWTGDFTVRRKDGSTFTAMVMDAPLRDDAGEIRGYVGISVDVTEERAAEERELHVQKMSAVGRLAGGIAHDFNNLLTAIQGHVGLLLLDTEGAIRDELLEIERNVQRGAALTRRLLSFSRNEEDERAAVQEVGPVIKDLESLLGRLLGEHILTEYRIEPGLFARIAPSRLEQVVVNLALNARDAMPGGGGLRISLDRVVFERDLVAARSRIPAGDWVRLAVADSGHGMDEETLARIFEPFYSTKGPDKGTGLGLATVQRIVDDHGGHCAVTSTTGKGSEFRIYLPAEAAEAEGARPPENRSDPGTDRRPRDGGTPDAPQDRASASVLIVDDDTDVRRVAERLLARGGFAVRSLGTANEALELFERDGVGIGAAVIDVGLPDMDGRLLVRQIRARRPGLPVLLTSGLTPEEVRASLEGDCPPILSKPFDADELVDCVRSLLGAGRVGRTAPDAGGAAAD